MFGIREDDDYLDRLANDPDYDDWLQQEVEKADAECFAPFVEQLTPTTDDIDWTDVPF